MWFQLLLEAAVNSTKVNQIMAQVYTGNHAVLSLAALVVADKAHRLQLFLLLISFCLSNLMNEFVCLSGRRLAAAARPTIQMTALVGYYFYPQLLCLFVCLPRPSSIFCSMSVLFANQWSSTESSLCFGGLLPSSSISLYYVSKLLLLLVYLISIAAFLFIISHF